MFAPRLAPADTDIPETVARAPRDMETPGRGAAGQAHMLQRSIGNQATARLLARQRGGASVVQRQPANPAAKPARVDTVPGLGPARTQDVEDLIAANDRQGAVDALVHYKAMDYAIDMNLLANKRMVYDAGLTSSDGTTAMPSWDYVSTPPKAEPAKVKIGPSAFSSASYLYSVIMHEYQHVLWQQTLAHQQTSNQAHQQGFVSPDEVEAGAWELLHANESGLARMPDKIAQIWENLNGFFWGLDAAAQASERPLVARALQKAKDFVKGSPVDAGSV